MRIVSKKTSKNTENRFKITIVEPEVAVPEFQYAPSDEYKDFILTGKTLNAAEFENAIDEVCDDQSRHDIHTFLVLIY